MDSNTSRLSEFAENGEDLDFMQTFLVCEMSRFTGNSHRKTKCKFVVEPEEAFMSMTRVSQIKSVDEQKKIEALYSKYLSMKNKFFEQVWREMVLPNMDAESFKLFLGG